MFTTWPRQDRFLWSVEFRIETYYLYSSDDEAGRDLARQFKLVATGKYEYIFVPDIKCSNVVFIKTTEGKEYILAPEGYPNSELIIREAIKETKIKMILLDNSELGKVDGCLTCCSVLIQ